MRCHVIYACFFLFACGNKPTKETIAVQAGDTATVSAAPATAAVANDTVAKDTTADVIPVARPIKKPSGIYRSLLPAAGDKKIIHTVAFYPATYRLQEEYPANKDSITITEGTWAPSEGTIWLYRDQIVRGRYIWKGDTLQYYSPRLKKYFSMEKLEPATANNVWQTKRKEGALLYGVGTEPFWSVEVNNQDSIVMNMPDWEAPLRAKLTSSNVAKDSAVYAAAGDSLHITVYPLFCNDGMSDFLYTRRMKLVYKGKTYRGCGELLRHPP